MKMMTKLMRGIQLIIKVSSVDWIFIVKMIMTTRILDSEDEPDNEQWEGEIDEDAEDDDNDDDEEGDEDDEDDVDDDDDEVRILVTF